MFLLTGRQGLTQTHWLTLSSRAGVAGTFREELKHPASRQELGADFSQTEVLAEAIVPFPGPPPTEPQSPQAGAISESLSTWLKTVKELRSTLVVTEKSSGYKVQHREYSQ